MKIKVREKKLPSKVINALLKFSRGGFSDVIILVGAIAIISYLIYRKLN